jgi:hypothetical protein
VGNLAAVVIFNPMPKAGENAGGSRLSNVTSACKPKFLFRPLLSLAERAGQC